MKLALALILASAAVAHAAPPDPVPPPAAPSRPVRLADLIREARARNPEVLAAAAMAGGADAAVTSAGAWDDPMLMVQLWNAPVDLSTVPVMVQITQPIALGGKREHRRAAARGEAEATRAAAAVKARDVDARVAKAYFDLFLADRTIAVDAQMIETLRALAAAASARIAAGRGEISESLRATSELLKLESDREAALARRTAASSRLLALLDRPPDGDIGAPLEPGLVSLLPPVRELWGRAKEQRAELAGARAAVQQSEARLRLADAARIPDIGVTAGDMHAFRAEGVSDFLFLGVQGNLPIFGGSKTDPQIRTAGAQLTASRQDARALENQVVAEVSDAYAEVVSEERQVALHHQLIPVATQALSSATAGYAAGRGSFLMVLDSVRDLQMHQLDLAMHLASYEQRLAELERAVGADLGLLAAAESGRGALDHGALP
jgi:outer membrane protein, heavy metal efflux system